MAPQRGRLPIFDAGRAGRRAKPRRDWSWLPRNDRRSSRDIDSSNGFPHLGVEVAESDRGGMTDQPIKKFMAGLLKSAFSGGRGTL